MRKNALKHGLTATMLVVLGEDAAAFRAMADAHLAVFQPRNAVELEFCKSLIGREPLDVLDEPPGELMDIFLACQKIDGGDETPFDELRCVVNDLEFDIVLEPLQGTNYERARPRARITPGRSLII